MKQTNPPKRITSTVLNALKGGVVPRVGLEYITVGRDREIDALLRDIDIIADGGAAFRFIVGKYGSGKKLPAANHPQLCHGARLCGGGCRPVA